MSFTPSNVVQYNEYYPFGLQTANSWTRENVTGNNFLGNGGTELNTSSNLYDLDFRNYDPILGRMNGVDPMATKYASLSPYNFSFNDPVTYNDPSGADPPQTINYGARNSGWFTSYTYDDRVDYDRGEWFQGGSSSAMSFHFGGRSGGNLINWGNAPSMAQLVSRQLAINFVNGVSSALASDHGGEVNLLTGSVNVFDERGSMIAGAMYMYTNGTITGSIAGALSTYFTPVYASVGDTEVPEYFEGVMIIDSEVLSLKDGAAMTLPGVGIFLSKKFYGERPADELRDLLKHEYGHILQAEKWGRDFFYEMIGPTSIISARENRDHKYAWTERTANYFSREYFKKENWNYVEYPIYFP